MAIRAAQSIGLHCVPPVSECSTAVERQSWELWYETDLADRIDLAFAPIDNEHTDSVF